MGRAPFDGVTLLGLAFAFGAVVGSFANVCIHRLPRGKSVVSPRSACPGCATPIAWFDNLPILSYAVLNGRCRSCKARIPFRYPLVEALTGLLFALVFWRHLNDPVNQPLAVTAVYLVATAGLVVLTFIDLDFRIIFDSFSFWAAAAAVPLSLFLPGLHVSFWPPLPAPPLQSHLDGLLASLAGAAVGASTIVGQWAMGVAYLWVKSRLIAQEALRALLHRSALTRWLVTGPSDPARDAVIGGGDLGLMAAVGGLLGWQGALLAFVIALISGALIGVVYAICVKDHYIAFGPFLALGMFGVLLARRELLDFLAAAFHHPGVL